MELGSLSFDTLQILEPGGYENLSAKFGSCAEGLVSSPWTVLSIIFCCCCPENEFLDTESVLYFYSGETLLTNCSLFLLFTERLHFSGVLLGNVIFWDVCSPAFKREWAINWLWGDDFRIKGQRDTMAVLVNIRCSRRRVSVAEPYNTNKSIYFLSLIHKIIAVFFLFGVDTVLIWNCSTKVMRPK